MTPRERLTNLQIVLLRSLARRGGQSTPVSLPAWQREAAIKLWRRSLVEVWFRNSLNQEAARGPFFTLTVVGARLALEFLNPAPRGISGAEQAP